MVVRKCGAWRANCAVLEVKCPGHDEPVECVLLESVQSPANRVEEFLPDAVAEERIQIPVVDILQCANVSIRRKGSMSQSDERQAWQRVRIPT